MRHRLVGAWALAMLSPTGAAGCGDDLPASARIAIEQGGTTIAFAPRPVPIAIGRHFSVDVVLCAADRATRRPLVRVDAEMPAHRHGMNYRATIRALGGERYAADGLMFHMPGRWRFVFDLGSGADTVRMTHEVDVE